MLAMLVCCMGTVSCSSDDDDDDLTTVTPPAGSSDETPSKIVGTWVERFQSSSNTIQVTTFTFTSSGVGQMIERAEYTNGFGISSDPINFRYTYNEGTEVIRMTFDGDATLYNGTATITGNTLMLSIKGTYYSLSKQ